MNEDLPTRIYDIHLLNPDVQKEQEDRFLARDVRIGPSGALEYTRIFTDSESSYKGFYNGEFLVQEIDQEDFEEMKHDHEHHHHHHDEEEEDE